MSTATFSYTNERGQSVDFGRRSHFLITNVDGVFGAKGDIATFSTYRQDGAGVSNKRIPTRDVDIGGRILRDVIKTRIHMLEVFNPKLEGTLRLTRGGFVRVLNCVVEKAPDFSSRRGDVFKIGFMAPNPYWQEERARRVDIATWIGAFEWPVEVPIETGIEFGYRTESRVINVHNDGDAETGMRVLFTAAGTVLNPSLVEVITYRQIRINATLYSGDQVSVTTGYGQKRAEIRRAGHMQWSNAIDLIDHGTSEFLQLQPGDNLLRYAADDGESMLSVAVFHTPQYVGV